MKIKQSFTGYIEGYYGRELSWEQRFGMIEHLHSHSLNTYFYAPKEDPFHRLQWRKSYPQKWIEPFKRFAALAEQKNITVIPAIAPGLSFDYLSKEDYRILLEKLTVFLNTGTETIALLMDDIPETLPESCKSQFSSLGEIHGILLNRLFSDLRKKYKKCNLWFCPTLYSDTLSGGNPCDCVYFNDLKKNMPCSITVMWTGPQIVSEKINMKNSINILKCFNGNVIFWDNFYANDYAPMRLFIGPYCGRQHSLLKHSNGLLINPTGFYHTDRFLISLYAGFIHNGKSTISDWKIIAEKYTISKSFYRISKFFSTPFYIPSKDDFSDKECKKYGDIFNDLIVNWQNPLKSEWYPFIQGFWQDIHCMNMDRKKQENWLYRHYPPVISLRLNKICR